ncbi:hypothetical protein ZWY2020_011071 [Hordeum vulgare]|nr:hypothetical protein ZWY2020_011071 [Hordeum vulgare]
MVVPTRGKALAATDLSISIPEGTYAHIGRAVEALHRRGHRVIDANYRAGASRYSTSEADFAVRRPGASCEMIVHVIATPEVAEVKHLDATLRGDRENGTAW